MDLRSYDLSGLDVSTRLDDLLQADFDSRTQWPASLPAPFDPVRIMELGVNPGLGVRSLHDRGIYYEEVHCQDESAKMHGPTVASILVGKTVGVAPEADLYFIGETHGSSSAGGFDPDFTYLAQSIDRLLEVNELLPAGGKIRVISISVSWDGGVPGREAADAALARAKKAGIFVITTDPMGTYGLRFHGLERVPLADPDDFASYGPVLGWGYDLTGNWPRDVLCVPMASRGAAAPNGPTDYAFYRLGGWSWCVPYLAGLYALACQVKPDVTPDEFWSTALETGRPIDLTAQEPDARGVIVDPVKLIDRLQGEG